MSITKDNPPEETASVSETHWWRQGEKLGKGTFGFVHVATLTELRDPPSENFLPVMAVKSANEPSAKADLERERLFLLLFRDCPNVIRYLGAEETPSRLNVFLELATGGTLSNMIGDSDGPLKERVVRRYARSILSAVNWIHERGFVHCDLKPSNVLLLKEGEEFVAKVADFGAAKREGYRQGLRGTLRYLAPESVRFGVQGKEGDIWALGCIVLKMLGGKLPWEGQHNFRMRRMIARASLEDNLPDEISSEAASFLRNCLAWNPRDRLTASELMNHSFVQDKEEQDILDDGNGDYVGDEAKEAKIEELKTAPIRVFWLKRWVNNTFKCLLP